jgi:hypothetical protein
MAAYEIDSAYIALHFARKRHEYHVESLAQQLVADSVCSLCLARVRIVRRLDEQTLVVACVGCGTVGWIEDVEVTA